MSAARLNHRVILQVRARIADGAGGFQETWEPLGTLWAEITARTGRVANGQAGAVSVTGLKVTVRAAPHGHASRPEPGQRFRMGARILAIEAVTELDTDARYLVCHCEEQVTP